MYLSQIKQWLSSYDGYFSISAGEMLRLFEAHSSRLGGPGQTGFKYLHGRTDPLLVAKALILCDII
jgi:hypothetical protein